MIMTLITLFSVAYAALSLRSYLFDNFVNRDTPVKETYNRFLNGEVP